MFKLLNEPSLPVERKPLSGPLLEDESDIVVASSRKYFMTKLPSRERTIRARWEQRTYLANLLLGRP